MKWVDVAGLYRLVLIKVGGLQSYTAQEQEVLFHNLILQETKVNSCLIRRSYGFLILRYQLHVFIS